MAEDPFKKALKAWHASPHDFEEFGPIRDVSGKGQGAAAYGRGLYVAESPKVSGPGESEYMREFLDHPAVSGRHQILENGSSVSHPGFDVLEDTTHSEWPANVVRAMLDHEDWPDQSRDGLLDGIHYVFGLAHADPKEILGEINSHGALSGDYDIDDAKALQNYLKKHEKDFTVGTIDAGSGQGPFSYEVNVHLTPETILDWDTNIDDHHPEARDKIRQVLTPHLNIFGGVGSYLYGLLSRALGSDYAASEALFEAGIHGIRYKDGNSRNLSPIHVDGIGVYQHPEWTKNAEVLQRIILAGGDVDEAARQARQLAKERKAPHFKLMADGILKYKGRISKPTGDEKPTYNYVIFHPDFVEAVAQYDIKGNKVKDLSPGVHLKAVDHDPFKEEK